jgi:hypothetical protein
VIVSQEQLMEVFEKVFLKYLARSLTAFQELVDTFITLRAKIANELEIISVLL